MIVWWLHLQLHVYKDENKLGTVEALIAWWLDLQLYVYKDENQLGNERHRMVVRFTATCI